MKHRNSQKRIYIKNAIYFITTNVDEPLFLFKEDLFCELFVEDLKFCREIKQFNIFGYKVNPDHIHLLIQPTGKYNYSEIMQNLKRVSSLHINQIIEKQWIQHELPENKYCFISKQKPDLSYTSQLEIIV